MKLPMEIPLKLFYSHRGSYLVYEPKNVDAKNFNSIDWSKYWVFDFRAEVVRDEWLAIPIECMQGYVTAKIVSYLYAVDNWEENSDFFEWFFYPEESEQLKNLWEEVKQ